MELEDRSKSILWKIHCWFMDHQQTGLLIIRTAPLLLTWLIFVLIARIPMFVPLTIFVWGVAAAIYIYYDIRWLRQKRRHYKAIRDERR